MKWIVCCSALSMASVAGWALADGVPGAAGGGCTCPIPPITFYTQPQPPPPKQGPVVPTSGPVFYHAEVAPAKWTEAPPPPPIHLYRLPPPQIYTYQLPPPPISICRAEVQPPHYTEAPPRPGITIFELAPPPTKEAPPIVIPPITFVTRGQPGGPVDLGVPTGYCPH